VHVELQFLIQSFLFIYESSMVFKETMV